MERSTLMSAAFGYNPISVFGIVFLLMILKWIIRLHLSNLRYALQFFIGFFLCSDKKVADDRHHHQQPSKLVLQLDYYVKEKELELKSNSSSITLQVQTLHANNINVDDNRKLCLGEIGSIMERLGSSKEIDDMFEEEEPSLEEVKEAFHVFDENKDGFIDAGEVRKVVCALGFVEASEVECKRMIKAFDNNGDGRIDFNEFVKLMEDSFR